MTVTHRLMPRDRWFDAIGEAIRRERNDRDWSQLRLGQEMGVTHVCICYWETGHTKPDAWTIERLELLFGARLRPQ